jgi:hypothetical protein
MENQVLSIEQMKHLQELGINTSKASMCWTLDCNYARRLVVHSVLSYDMTVKTAIPTFTLQDILELLPYKIIAGFLHIGRKSFSGNLLFFMEYPDHVRFAGKSILDAAYDMLCWCIENGHIAKNE